MAQLVAIALVVALVRVWVFDPPPALRVAGVALVAAGAALGAWAVPHLGRGLTPVPLPNGRTGLVTSGPYRLMRHPMYTSVMAAAGGLALAAGSGASLVGWVVLVAVLSAKARWEEARLVEHFPGYAAHAAATRRFVPVPRRRQS